MSAASKIRHSWPVFDRIRNPGECPQNPRMLSLPDLPVRHSFSDGVTGQSHHDLGYCLVVEWQFMEVSHEAQEVESWACIGCASIVFAREMSWRIYETIICFDKAKKTKVFWNQLIMIDREILFQGCICNYAKNYFSILGTFRKLFSFSN
jgi:hypothetical protein